MSDKERVVFLDRAAFTADDLPIPSFDHNWSEIPGHRSSRPRRLG
ncbi:MAG: hypothetical protein U0938_14120 [Thiobacillus sp.]|nr:hypothetical protein [Thiobacillus sp.]